MEMLELEGGVFSFTLSVPIYLSANYLWMLQVASGMQERGEKVENGKKESE